MNLVLFDFDGTISQKDSMFDFIQYAVGKRAFYLGIAGLMPMLISFKLGFINNQKAKQNLLQHFFKHWPQKQFSATAKQYATSQLPSIIRPKALAKIKWHQQQGDTVVVVSASLKNWLQAWCDANNLELLATEYDLENNFFISPNCSGSEKVKRIKQRFDRTQFSSTIAYGDSSGDKEMLAWADHSFYRFF